MKQPSDDYVAKKEAARLLGVSVRGIERWVDRGLLTPRMPLGRKGVFFLFEDVQALRALREDKSADVWTIKVMAMQAISIARATEARLLQVFEHLGLNATPLARDEAGVQYLYQYTLEETTLEKLTNPAWVRFWAGSFFMMDEVYLELVTLHTDDAEPWLRFMDFANDVSRRTVELEAHEDLRAAYRYFDAGKRHLWYIGYMTCRRAHGRRIADQVFGGAKSAVDELMAVLH